MASLGGLFKSFRTVAALAAWALAQAFQPAAAFEIGVSPMRFEFPLTKRPVTQALKVLNRSNNPMKIRLRVAHFDLDENNKVREIKPTAQSLDQWLIVRPLNFTIPPGQTQTVRFAVRPYTTPAPGEHRAIIFLERGDAETAKHSGALDIGFRFGVAIYGNAGQIVRSGTVHDVAVDGKAARFDISSTGNAHIRLDGAFGIWPEKAFPGKLKASASIQKRSFSKTRDYVPEGAVRAGMLPNLPILPNTRRTLVSEFQPPLPPGRYTLHIDGTLDTKSVSRTLSIDVTE